MSEPSAALTPPVAEDPIPNVLENALDGSYTSPTYLVGEALVFCGMVGSNDPWAVVADKLAGNWQAMQSAGKSLSALTDFNISMAEEISSASARARESWHGEAGDSASRYFDALASAVKAQSNAIRGMSEQLEQTAMGLYEASEAIKDLVSTLIDWLIAIGAQLAAAAVSAATGLGTAVSAGMLGSALLMAKRAWEVVSKITEVIGYAWSGAQSTVGLISGHLATVKDKPLPKLPANSYTFTGE